MRILVVEDEPVLRETITAMLTEEDYTVDAVGAGDEGLYAAEQGIYDMVVLDIMLPEMNGFEIVKALRKQGNVVPILLLTARDSVDDRVSGLESGADDYLVKPFAMRELQARIKALLRRKGNLANESGHSYGKLHLNAKNHDATVDGQALGLTSKEYGMLEFFILNKEQVLTREQLFDRIWGFDSDTTDTIVDLYVHYLRKKLAPHGLDKIIRTVRGSGFMLKG